MVFSKGNRALEWVKIILWMMVGMWSVVIVARMINGIGASSGLSDATPWGFWIAMVESGVAFAAGGFVLAAVVYVFGIERYHDFARRAILIALLGYLTAATGLFFELGLPWHVINPLIYQQHHSVLFEVAMCVMCYLTVLALEFSPAVLEHPLFHRPLFLRLMKIVKKMTLPLVIAGIVFSTLHQSSLGSLFLIQPYRVHPLWYSELLPRLFYLSAIGLGLMVVTLESLLSGWLFGHKIEVDKLAGLGRIASIVLSAYLLLRIGDLWYRGILPGALDGSFASAVFLVELLLSAALPATLLAFRRVRHSIAGLATCGICTFLGVVGYRFNICYIVFTRPADMPYFPTWTEIVVSLGIMAITSLMFIFFNENLKIVGHHGHDDHAPPPEPFKLQEVIRKPEFGQAFRRHSLAFVVAGGLAFGFLPQDAVFGPKPVHVPVQLSRTVEAVAVPVNDPPIKREFHIASLAGAIPASLNPQPVQVMLIDGNRNWRFVAFPHDGHIATLGGQDSCRLCHHQNAPFDQNTACYQCHRDMYEVTDTFEHNLHAEKLGGNAGCVVCHRDPDGRKSRETALACWQCHGDMVVKDSIVPPHPKGLQGFAPGYMDAMHGLCIRCHEQKAKAQPEVFTADFGRCDVCHREFKDTQHRLLAPYVPMPPGHETVGQPASAADRSGPVRSSS